MPPGIHMAIASRASDRKAVVDVNASGAGLAMRWRCTGPNVAWSLGVNGLKSHRSDSPWRADRQSRWRVQ